jgi:hypothetical protein
MLAGLSGLLLFLAIVPASPYSLGARSGIVPASALTPSAVLSSSRTTHTPVLSDLEAGGLIRPETSTRGLCSGEDCAEDHPPGLGLRNPFVENQHSVPSLFDSLGANVGSASSIWSTSLPGRSVADVPDTQSPQKVVVPASGFEPVTVAAEPQNPPKVRWRQLMGASFRYLGVMHAFRLATEAGTRYGLEHNPFWGGYMAALGAMHGWSDGDGYYENYLGHPIQGSVSAYIWIHNDPRYRYVEFGKDPNYWKSRLRAYAYSWAFSEQFEVGLLSEASIGQIQRYCCQYGFVDHVITPNGGMLWVVGEDMLDKYVVRRIEDHTSNLGLRIGARIVLNPVQSFANFMNLEYPWYRENRDAPSRYEANTAHTYMNAVKPEEGVQSTYPLVPKFEITATLPSVMNIGGLSCLGGGGVGGFRIAENWQWTAEVSGCTLGNSLPQNWSGDSLTFTTGPQWIRHTEGRWTPHVHMRFGGQKITLQHTNPEERELIASMLPPGTKLNPYYNLFNTNYESTGVSLSMGGGFDYRLYPGLALRVANLDYVRSWLNPVNGIDFNRGVRFTTGLVLRLGTW